MSKAHTPQIVIDPQTGHRVDVFRDEDGVPRCNAKKRGKDERCRGMPMLGRLRCKMHGGMTLAGPESPRWKHGKQSRWRTALGIADSNGTDDSWLDMREPVEIQKEAINRLAERIGEKDSGQLRRRALKLAEAAIAALEANQVKKLAEALRDLRKLLRDGLAVDKSLRDLSFMSEALTRQVTAAHAVRLKYGQALAREDAARFMATVTSTVLEIAGKDVAQQVFARLRREALGGINPAGGSGDGFVDLPRDAPVED